jgi:hypothetical protein
MFSDIDDDPVLITRLDTQPVLRNLLISQGYHELSDAFATTFGRENITWFTFAAWSSKVVGQFLQNEELPDILRVWIEGSGSAATRLAHLNTELTSMHAGAGEAHKRGLDAAVRCAINDMRMYLACGNTEVFGELAPIFGRFLKEFGADATPDVPRLERYLTTLQSGTCTPDEVAVDPSTHRLHMTGRGGQTLLQDALRHYYEAKFEPNLKRRAELMLFANANIGLHEQTRLQTYIAGALNAPLADTLVDTTHDALADILGKEMFGRASLNLIDQLLRPLANQVQDLFHRFATEFMMTLKLPDGTLHLGRDLPAAPGEPLFPPALETLHDSELARLFAHYNALAQRTDPLWPVKRLQDDAQRLLGRLGLEPNSAYGSGADDWVSLSQRMRYILELFRSRQQNQRLLEPIFSADQVALLKQGKIPPGPLW